MPRSIRVFAILFYFEENKLSLFRFIFVFLLSNGEMKLVKQKGNLNQIRNY